MAKKKLPVKPSMIHKPNKEPVVKHPDDPEQPLNVHEDDPDEIPGEDELDENTPPYEAPEPGEGP